MKRCGVLVLAALFIPLLISQVEGGTSLAISHAVFNPDDGLMTLHGSNFESFGPLEVWIGDICLTCSTPAVCSTTPDTIECNLTGTPPASLGGTWKVWISACNSPHCKDEIHLAITTSVATCNSGDFVECYTGPAGTSGIGVCASGARSCIGGDWGGCEGEVVPANELCNDGLDNDCDGFFDLQDSDCCLDIDGDGYGTGPYCLGLDCDDSNPDVPGAPCDGPDSDACEEGIWECVGETVQCTDTTGDSTEICNGLDDDCNGIPDDRPDLCEDGLSCTFNTCSGGNCTSSLSSSACLIDGVCYTQGQSNPDSACLVCYPSVSQASWRLVPGTCLIDDFCYANGQDNPTNACEYCDSSSNPYDWRDRTCNDGDPCTMDSCDPFNGCVHTMVSCDDGLACTHDSCDSSTGSCVSESICFGTETFTCPPTSVFSSSWTCTSAVYCSTATGQCTADDCCF